MYRILFVELRSLENLGYTLATRKTNRFTLRTSSINQISMILLGFGVLHLHLVRVTSSAVQLFYIFRSSFWTRNNPKSSLLGKTLWLFHLIADSSLICLMRITAIFLKVFSLVLWIFLRSKYWSKISVAWCGSCPLSRSLLRYDSSRLFDIVLFRISLLKVAFA